MGKIKKRVGSAGISLGEVLETQPDENATFPISPAEKASIPTKAGTVTTHATNIPLTEEQSPEPPKRNLLVEGLKIVNQGLENYAGQRAGEAEDETQKAYRSKLHDYNTLRFEVLKKKKAEGKLIDPKEIKEYILRGGSMIKNESEEKFSF